MGVLPCFDRMMGDRVEGDDVSLLVKGIDFLFVDFGGVAVQRNREHHTIENDNRVAREPAEKQFGASLQLPVGPQRVLLNAHL